jgi:glutaredoxin
LLLGVVIGLPSAACKHHDNSDGTKDDEGPAGAEPKPNELPPLVVKDDTPDLLLTWVDDQGDFHVAQKIADVPAEHRDAVRAVITTKREGTAELVYVADFRQKKPDGTNAVRTQTRAHWEELGAGKRKARLEALAPSEKPPTPPAPSGAVAGEVSATIYGAEWCGPCHEAERLLKRLGVHVTKKDIEKNPEAQDEMQAVLRKAHRSGGSIPVIDIMGQVFVGFSSGALRQAVETARDRQTL